MSGAAKSWLLHAGVLAALVVLWAILPAYYAGNLARILVLAVYAIGYNLAFGYTGLLSLGHALFFAAGMYGFGLLIAQTNSPAELAMIAGVVCALGVGAAVAFLALRTREVAFMIVTLMFAQAGFLIILYFGAFTRGDEGFVVDPARRALLGFDLSSETARFWAAWALFALAFLGTAALVKSATGRAMIAVRENEERARMLGYDTHRLRFLAFVISAGLSGLAGAAYALLFGYVGATFATVQYSIFPLLWVLLGGVGTTIGPLIGVFVMFYLIDFSSTVTAAYMIVVGVALVLLTLFAPLGIAGEIRKRWARWLP